MDHGVGVAEAIEALRTDLQKVIEVGRDQPLRFKLSPIEVTLQVEVTKDANGKVGWKVLEVGGGLGSTRTQTVKLTLEPGWLQADGTYLDRGQFTVASVSAEHSSFGPIDPTLHQ
jgi:Trypsin-co-occurring domain 2